MAIQGFQDFGTEVLSTTSSTSSGGGSGALIAPIRGFRFTVDFAGLGTTSFRSASGFSVDVDPITYREGSFGRLTVRKLPGLVSYSDITLTKGVYNNLLIYNFFNKFLEGETNAPIESATITVFDNAAQPRARWNVISAWPIHYESTDLNADSSDILVETLVLTHEGIHRVEVT
jgi:phage tail-like protein